MPELPEVETVRRGLAPLVGARIEQAQAFHPRSVRRHDGGAPAFAAELAGARIASAERRGKYLWLPLQRDASNSNDGGAGAPDKLRSDFLGQGAAVALLVHLGMSGQLRVQHGDIPDSHRHLRARLYCVTASGERVFLDFIDQRTFGHVAVVDLIQTADGALPELATHIARDLLDDRFSALDVAKRIMAKRSEIKRVLLDQTVVSGIGNIYADEALWAASVHPQSPAHELSQIEVVAVLAAAQSVVDRAVQVGGTSFDAQYVDSNGEPGRFGDQLDAYARTGKPCRKCGTPIQKITFMNRSSHLCPSCQQVTWR